MRIELQAAYDEVRRGDHAAAARELDKLDRRELLHSLNCLARLRSIAKIVKEERVKPTKDDDAHDRSRRRDRGRG